MRAKILTSIFYLLALTALGQSGELSLKNDLSINDRHLVISVAVTNLGEKSLFMNTSNFFIVSDISDSLISGLRVSLESESGELIYYNYPMTFIQMENVKRQVKRSARINKRQQPKIKINPKHTLIIKKESTKILTLKIPLQHWTLSNGETYTVNLDYKRMDGIKEPNNSIQINHLTVDIGSFTY